MLPNTTLGYSYPFKITFLSLLLFGLFSTTFHTAQACVDPGPDTLVKTIVNYDTTFAQVEIRVTNLRLMSENPGKFCTCALSSFSSLFTNLLYVAFVDSGTNTPYWGFAPWTETQAASDAWDAAVTPSGTGWDGFVADVVNTGLQANAQVELLIRASLPAGYTLVLLDSAVTSMEIGTDEYSPTGDSLVGAHPGIRYGYDYPITYDVKPGAYFSQLDSAVEAGNTTRLEPRPNLQLLYGPNPTSTALQLSYFLPQKETVQVELWNLQGQRVAILDQPYQRLGRVEAVYNLAPYSLSRGMYLLRIRSSAWQVSRRLVIE